MGRVLYGNGADGKTIAHKSVAVETKEQVKNVKKERPENLFTKIIFAIATVCVCSGLIWFAFMNSQRYENLVGKAKHIYVTVLGVEEQTDVESAENADVTIQRYHLTTQYDDHGYQRDIVLNEGYIDKELAESYVGEKRWIAVDNSSWKNLVDKGISYWCALPVCIGLLIYSVLGLIYIRKK